MYAIFRKEIMTFLTSPSGYLVPGLFLVLNGLFLWVFKGPYNIPDYGFADMSHFFLLAPWVFLFLVPAITMKSFSEEMKLGTMEHLLIKPLPLWHIVAGKFFGAAVLAMFAILPTLIYAYAISRLGVIQGNLDMGLVWGSYFGLLFLVFSYISIGIFTSTLTQSQVTAFLTALLLAFALYYGFDAVATLFIEGGGEVTIKSLGMKWHFERLAGGVLDTRDLVYFLGLIGFFAYLSVNQLRSQNR